MKVSIAGAGSHGSALALRLALADYVDEILLIDVIEGRPQGLALDMMHMRAIEGFKTRVVGSNDWAETAGSDVCVIAAGARRKPGMSRADLLDANAPIVHDVTLRLVEHSPDTVLVVVSNPIDEMLALCEKVCGFPRRKVIGEAGLLNTARFKHLVAERFGITPDRVEAIMLGSHGETMVPVPSLARVDGRPLTEMLADVDIAALVEKTRDAAAEVIAYLKTLSGYHAAAAAAELTVRAIVHDSDDVMPLCVWMCGEYGIADVFLGVPARVGRDGVKEVVELPLTDTELANLRHAAKVVRVRQAEAEQIPLDVPGNNRAGGGRRRWFSR